MCGCKHHFDDNAPCTCTCDEHATIREEMARQKALAATRPAPPLPFEPPRLRELIYAIGYKPRWQFSLGIFREAGEARAWAFYVVSDTEDSLNPTQRIRVRHEFLVPPASWNRDTWAAWLFDRIRDVESHEAAEFFRLDGYREFAPHHGNGEDPYRVWHVGDHDTARKRAGDD